MSIKKVTLGSGILLFLLSCQPSHQELTDKEGVYIQLHGKKYERMFLEGRHINFSTTASYSLIKFEGYSKDGYRWFFNIPDSINQVMLLYYIKTDTFHYQTKTDHIIRLKAVSGQDTIPSSYFTFDNKMKVVHLNYLNSGARELDQYEVDDTLFWEGPIHLNVDNYEVDLQKKDTTELEILMKTSGYPNWEQLDSLSVMYPNSKTLMSQLLNFRWMNKENLTTIYDRFSAKNRESHLGQMIAGYLNFNDSSFVFDNIKLPSWDNEEKQEYVIQDSTQYTLIIFSASWCGPCHERIPLLKEIYSEKTDQLDMVYVSIDDHRTVSRWSEWVMIKEQIPWRSLVFPNDEMLQSVIPKYLHRGIPDFTLVLPDGKAKKIDLLTQYDKMKLYEIINN